MRVKSSTLFILALMFIAGCTTITTVRKVNPLTDEGSTPGIRYSLPRTFIQMVPQEDGSLLPQPLYLPDLDKTYAIDAYTVAGEYTLNVDLSNGLLSKVAFKANSGAVAAAAVESAGNATKAIVDARVQRTKDIADAQKAVQDAQIDVEFAKKKFDRVHGDPKVSQDDQDAAEKALRQAESTLRAAQRKLSQLTGKSSDDAGAAATAGAANSTNSATTSNTAATANTGAGAKPAKTVFGIAENKKGYVKLLPIKPIASQRP